MPSISSRLDAQLSLLKSNVRDDSQDFNKLSLDLSYKQDIGAWNAGLNLHINRTNYGAIAVFDREIKKNKQATVEITLLNKLWQINGIAPKLSIGKTKNRSNY